MVHEFRFVHCRIVPFWDISLNTHHNVIFRLFEVLEPVHDGLFTLSIDIRVKASLSLSDKVPEEVCRHDTLRKVLENPDNLGLALTEVFPHKTIRADVCEKFVFMGRVQFVP